ncbi:MAG: PQQ-binding-like beta-propeller repeat protein [Acidobacteriota bacterium]
MKKLRGTLSYCLLGIMVMTGGARAGETDAVMFGHTPSRNMATRDKGLPATWDVGSGLNIKWTAELGSQSYGGPVVAGGKVFVGTNNQKLRNPKLKGDRGNVLVFQESDGTFLWQAAHAKLTAGRVNDWPLQGVCSTPAIQGDRVYYVSNRAEIICADTEGFQDGANDGPFTAEDEKSAIDEDVVWKLDMIVELDVFPHNLAAGNPLIVDDLLFTVTGQGVDEGHVNIPSPLAPDFIAVNTKTGKLAWENADPSPHLLHGSWSNPAYGVIGGKPQVIFPGGDGWLYAFEPRTGKLIWKFDLNPKDSVWELGGSGTRNNVISTPVVYHDRVYIGVGQDPEHGEAPGHFWVVDATGAGDITGKGVVWHIGGDAFHRTLSTAAIQDGLVYIADLSGFLHCLDAETGKEYWKYDAFAAVWGSAFVADGKVYLGDEDGDVAVLAAGKTMNLLGEINMGGAVYTTPVAHDGTLFISTRNKLYAIHDGIPARSVPASGTGSR